MIDVAFLVPASPVPLAYFFLLSISLLNQSELKSQMIQDMMDWEFALAAAQV